MRVSIALLVSTVTAVAVVTASESDVKSATPTTTRSTLLQGHLGMHLRSSVAAEAPPNLPPVVFLHGMCGEPEHGCGMLEAIGVGDAVCPRADATCPSGGAIWSRGAGALARIEAATTAAANDPTPSASASPSTILIGFSQGAYLALREIGAHPARYHSLVLIGAFVQPTRRQLEAAGIKRVVLAAGDLDGSSKTMRESARRLAEEGFAARFVSLGKVGHTYYADPPSTVKDALTWVSAND